MNERSKDMTGRQVWELQAIRLPKLVEADPQGKELLTGLMAHARPLWPGGRIMAPTVHFTTELAEVLQKARTEGQLVRGLEDAEVKLAAETRGLGLVDQKSGVLRGVRVSRLVVLADDGTERFYRQVEKLLRQNGPRVLALRLDVKADALGQVIFNTEQRILLLMLVHKDAVSSMLLAMAVKPGFTAS